MKSVRLIFAGGGTGGHLYPALAIADKVKELLEDKTSVEIIFIGTKRGIEYRLKDSLGYPLHIINMRGIARSLTLKNLMVPFIVFGALMKSWLLLKSFKPNIVIGTGGYVSWPILKVASWKNIRTLLQEQNSFPGITTRQLAPKAKKIYLGFEKAKEYLHTNAEILTTGNPVRSEIQLMLKEDACQKLQLDPNKKTILILGGSQGARAINNAIIKSLQLCDIDVNYQLMWQTGKRDYKDVAMQVGNKVRSFSLFPFANNMAELYSAADIVIARAGALTLAEIINCKLPSILIPFPFAAGDHQKKNAMDYVDRNMAIMISEDSLDSIDILAKAISVCESEEYETMKASIEKETENKKPAVELIAMDIIRQLEEMNILQEVA